jgi:hypothetical protein
MFKRTLPTTFLLFTLLLLTATVLSAAGSDYTNVTSGSYTFRNFQLGALPTEYCPNVNSPCQNGAAEPQIRADPFGYLYASSENGITSGTEAWKSIDSGLHFTHLQSPNQISNPIPGSNETGLSPAGGDTDLATATAKNAGGLYNVYVASLEASSVYVSSSQDGGLTWSPNPVSTLPADDREWIAAEGASKVCVSYQHAAGLVLSPAGIDVDCSNDAGTTFPQVADVIDANHVAVRAGFKIGNLAIDPNNHYIYQTFSSQFLQDATNPNPTGNHVVYMAVSTDGGQTFTDYTVYANPDATVDYGHQFVNVSVDRAGNVYSLYSDNHNLYLSFSTTHGQTWNGPFLVNKTPSNTAIFPWAVAGSAGKLDIVWYGTSYYDGVNPPDNYPTSAAWYVYFAQNLKVLTNPTGFTQVRATPIVHYGGVCESGAACTGSRDLYDDFGVTINPLTGLASIVYSDDQYNQYNTNITYSTTCTPANNNTRSCDHTSIAAQTTGPVLIGK